MSLSATIFGRDSLIFKATNVLGLGLPGLLDKTFGAPELKGPRLGEISQQTAKESEPRVIVWGRVRPIGGNLIHCQTPIKKMVKESVDSGGKGGGSKKTQKVEHVFRTYALGVCEGPITAFSRIWRNSKLVYDARGNAWGRKNNGVFLKNYRLYLGLWTQMPSPYLEAIWGAGNVPAYRGTAYMVAINEDLTELSGAVPQWQFEVERAEGYALTSRPYAVEVVESLQSNGESVTAPWQGFTEALGSGGSRVADGSLRSVLTTYPLIDGLGSAGSTVTGGALREILKTYAMTPEALTSGGSAIASGSLKQILISYNFSPEAIGSGGLSLVSGTLV
jgi:hypothetical protein